MLNLTGIKNYKILLEKKIIFLSNLTKRTMTTFYFTLQEVSVIQMC